MILLSELFRLCLDTPYLHADNGASFAVRSRGDVLYILFQKSEGAEDWYNNLDFPAAPYRDMATEWRAHRGFLRVWKSAEPYIEEILAETAYRRITVAGYSHGGALAVLCHEYIWFRYPSLRADLHGVGFGAPRVIRCGRECRAAAHRWTQFTVVRCGRDAVTHLPPALLGYRHMGRLLTVGSRQLSPTEAHMPQSYTDALLEYENKKAGVPYGDSLN